MAIKPKLQYPANVSVTDPAYPWGKARDVVTAGDGTGTPWEAAIANDIFGFQQALLDAAGIEPSNTPDKVGASQYLTALAPALFGRVFAWTAQHTFAQEINYDALKTFRKIIPLASGLTPSPPGTFTPVFQPPFLAPPCWVWPAGSSLTDLLTFAVDLPTGAVVTDLDISVHDVSGGHNVMAVLSGWPIVGGGGVGSLISMRFANPVMPGGDFPVNVPQNGAAIQAIDRSTNDYAISIAIENPGAPTIAELSWVSIGYTMPGYRNG